MSAQCDLITVNGSTQIPSGVCAPVNFGMEAHYEFLFPVDPALVQILYRWNDAANTTTLVPGNWNAANDSVWATASHVYLPDDECSKTAEAILVYDGVPCISSGYQSQIFATWGTDEENSGVLQIEPVVHYICEGVDVVDFTFEDNSTFNCNISIEQDRPNRLDRWVQFHYNTYNQAGDRIPNVTVRDGGGTVHTMTDAAGNFVANLDGPIIRIPYPADGPNQTSFPISAPAGGVAGDIFEITLRNWNVCNPYDNTPNNGLPPADVINGDNPPILTTARIEIIAPTPVTVPALFEYCTGNVPVLTANAGAAEIRWYQDVTLDTLLHIGPNYYPSAAPFYLDYDVPGSYSFYVTTYQGFCESAPIRVDLTIYQSPNPAFAGNDQTICADTVTLRANSSPVGTTSWSTTGMAMILSPSDSITHVTNLDFGPNQFAWTISNGPCTTSDYVTIFSDRQPDAANAGPDQQLCDISVLPLSATAPNLMGRGIWNVVSGNGFFADSSLPNTSVSGLAHTSNILVWRVSSRYGVCPVSYDSVQLTADFSAGVAFAGPDRLFCEISATPLSGNPPVNSGIGYWRLLSGSGSIADTSSAITFINGFGYGTTILSWNLESKLDICPLSTDTLRIVHDQTPGPALAGPDKAFCFVTQDSLIGNTPTLGSGSWNVLLNPSGTAPAFSPNNLTPHTLFSVLPGNEGFYQLEWRLQNGSCITRDTVNIDFGVPVPQALAGTDTVACGYDYQLHGNQIVQGLGTWSVLSGPGAVSFTPGIHQPNAITTFLPGFEGLYQFEWRFTSGSCPPTADTVNIEITLAPLAPVLTSLQSCGPDSFSISIPAGNPRNKVYWYANLTDSLAFFSGNPYSTGVLSNSTTYYVKLRDTISTCESSRVPQPVTIDLVPDAPLLTGDTLCEPGTATFSAIPIAPANSVLWYDLLAGSALDTANFLVVNPLAASRYYYARGLNTLTGCMSEADSVRGVVHPVIPAPLVEGDSACGGAVFVLGAVKSHAGNSLFWYNSDTNLVAIGDSLTTSLISASTDFFVAEYNPLTQCLSDLNRAPIVIHPVPALPLINDTSSCGPSQFVLHASGSPVPGTFRWYDDPIAGNMLAENDSLTSPYLISSRTYWVSGVNTVTGCEGPREQVDVAIYPNPALIDILGPTLVLKDQSNVVFFVINGQPGSSYTWDIPSEVVVESNMNDFVRLAFPQTGSFILSSFETTIHGCIGTPVYHSITVINDSIAVDIGDVDQVACTAEMFEIKPWLFGGTPPYIYNWTGDTQYLSSVNTLFTQFDPPGTGQFRLYLEVIDVNLKVARDSVVITVHESPVTAILNTDFLTCVGDQYQILTQSSGTGPFTHLWTGPIHRLDNYAIAQPVYVPYRADTATFYYLLSDAMGCRAYDSIQIVSDEAIANFDVLTPPGCSPLAVQFENNSLNAAGYFWNFDGAGTSTAINPSFTFVNTTPEINYLEVSLLATSPLGCTDEAKNYVMVWPNPNADITALPQTSCNPARSMLVSTPGNRYYHWNFGDGGTDTTTSDFNVFHTWYNPSFTDRHYMARVITESPLGCFDTAQVQITVFATPEASFTVTPEESTFPDNRFELDNTTAGNWTYYWNFDNGTSSDLQQPGEVVYSEQGYYSIRLTVAGNNCSDSVTHNVRLMPAPPVAEFKGADDGCMPHTVTLINNSQYAHSYYWEFGDGSVSTAKDPTYTYYEPGIYKIKLRVAGPGGVAEFSDTTRVFVLPHSFFDLAPRYVYVNDEPVHYFNLSDHDDIIEWDFGDGNKSTEQSPKHIYKQEGVYNVTLKVWTINGCFDLYVMENAVLVEPSGIIEFPNAFRPNSNIEENRVFKPGVIDHVANYHLMIFNRWGELIFESFDQEIGWDGSYAGKIAKQDVYVWKVIGSYSDGKGFEKTGNVTLLY